VEAAIIMRVNCSGMNEDEYRSRAGLQFRRSGRWLVVLLVALFPVGLFSSKLSNHLHSDLPVGVSPATLMVCLIYLCVWRYVTYCRWTGKYPLYWLRGRIEGASLCNLLLTSINGERSLPELLKHQAEHPTCINGNQLPPLIRQPPERLS
jgi:hypothetical protein